MWEDEGVAFEQGKDLTEGEEEQTVPSGGCAPLSFFRIKKKGRPRILRRARRVGGFQKKGEGKNDLRMPP